MSEYDIRAATTIEELRACVALQEDTWGSGFSERVPSVILKVAQMLGGVCAGAWAPDGTLAGFVFGLTGVRDGEIIHWSDMLAVRSEVRDAGLGTRLKLYQRELLLAGGVTTMQWAFDPLQSRNAHLNFSKLGIVVREYILDMYGETDSPLHRGIGTDRFIALWLMEGDRARRRLAGEEQGPAEEALESSAVVLAEDTPAEGTAAVGGPCSPLLGSDATAVSVAIPADISSVMAASMEVARAWRLATRAAFTHYIGRGYEVRELVRGERISHYLLFRTRESDVPSADSPDGEGQG